MKLRAPHSFSKYVLSTHPMPGPVLDTGHAVVTSGYEKINGAVG